MSDRIRMEHPKLPGQPIYARPGGVQACRRAGWREAPEPEPEPAADEQQERKPSRRRRVNTMEENDGADAA